MCVHVFCVCSHVCICVCMCVHVGVCMCVRVCMRMHVHVHVHARVRMCLCVHAYPCMRACVFVCMGVCVHMPMPACVYASIYLFYRLIYVSYYEAVEPMLQDPWCVCVYVYVGFSFSFLYLKPRTFFFPLCMSNGSTLHFHILLGKTRCYNSSQVSKIETPRDTEFCLGGRTIYKDVWLYRGDVQNSRMYI